MEIVSVSKIKVPLENSADIIQKKVPSTRQKQSSIGGLLSVLQQLLRVDADDF